MRTAVCAPIACLAAGSLLAIVALSPAQCHAQPAPTGAGSSLLDPIYEYFATWFQRVSATQAEQPHWITPIVTVTPRLEEEFRYDQIWQAQPKGNALNSFGGAKGLELIPSERIELILGVPAWLDRNFPHDKDGWADETFLIKYRILAANEEAGNYILTAFLGISVPTAEREINSSGQYMWTPTIAFGKGWGAFDFQSTAAVTVPNSDFNRIGMPVAWNTAFQYHIDRILWPELEFNYTWWAEGPRTGKNQLFLTPGIIIGRIPIWKRVALVGGVGYQVAVTSDPLYNHGVILTGRIPF